MIRGGFMELSDKNSDEIYRFDHPNWGDSWGTDNGGWHTDGWNDSWDNSSK